jgi:iron complex outermembrane receptor protein
VLAENHFRINDRQQMNVRFWYQSSDRNIPPTMLQASSAAKQQDASYRVTSEWQRTGAKVKTSVRAAYFDEQLRWFAFADELSSLSRSQNVIAEAEAKVHLTADQTINVGVNNTFAQAVSDGYPDRPQQNRTALFGSYQLNALRKRLLSTLSARQELIGAKLVPFTFSLGSEYVCTNWLTTKANVSKVYRVPTFNDLYWKPGGNPELLPESGFSGDVGLAAKWVPTGKRYTLTAEVTAFHRRIENWIIWLPGPSYWSPQNIMNVWSRGIESRSEVGVRMRKALVKVGVMTNYVVSTNEQAKTMNDASVGKQLIYVPMYSGSAKLSIMYKAFSATYMMTYTGYRYTSTDNRQFLEPYTLANAAIAYELKPGRRYKVSLLAQAFNLFDEAYEVMLSRPMPLSNYQFGVRVNFDQPLKRNPLPQ